MATTELRVFVYGTLKPGERAFNQLCEPYGPTQQAAIVPGRLYHLPLGYPAMTLETGWVQGVLLTFPTLAVLAGLDDFEDYYPDRPQQSEYQRLCQTVRSPDRLVLSSAWVYTMARHQIDALGGVWIPTGHWSERSFNAKK